MTPISERDKRMNTHDAAWMLYDAERMENERLQAENAALKADLISVGKARQTLMDDNLKLIEDVAKLKEQITEANKERAWVRRKLELPEGTGFLSGDVTLAGTMHCVWSGYKGYHNYILAEKCDDKMGEIARQSVEIESLKEQVAQLELVKDEHDERGIDIDILVRNLNSAEAQLTALQSKSAALVDASQLAADQIRKCDYTPARSTLLVALAAFKGEK